ncbi:MAG: proton-conducting transporter membrane subunit [Methylocella sp.]
MPSIALSDSTTTASGYLLVLAVILPVIGLLLAFLLGGRRAEQIALGLMPIGLCLAAAIAFGVWRADGVLVYVLGGWSPPLGVALRADGFSAVMLVTTALIVTAAAFFARANFSTPLDLTEARAPLSFWTLLLALWAALNCVFLGGDLFNLYVALELLTFAAVPIVCLDGQAATLKAALRYLLFALFGSVLYLLGIALLYGAYGALDIVVLSQRVRPEAALWVAMALMTAGLAAKTALVPLYLWLPPAHAGAPPAGSAMLSALVVKASFFIAVRLWFHVMSPLPREAAMQILAALGAGAIIFGSVLALRQERLKLLIAYSTVAQIGYLFLMFPLAAGEHPWTDAAWTGGVLQAVSHAFAKAAMFLAAGLIAETLGHDRIAGLRGAGRLMPMTIFAFGLGGLSLMGLPPSGGFVAKWLLLTAAVESGQWLWALAMLAGGLLAGAYVFRVLAPALASANANEPSPRPSPGRGREAAALALALFAMLIGFAPPALFELIQIGRPQIARPVTTIVTSR